MALELRALELETMIFTHYKQNKSQKEGGEGKRGEEGVQM